MPSANGRAPGDPGVAVYFTYRGNQVCFACDRWNSVKDNIQAVRRTIEALRGIARWGTGDMMAAAFQGFIALPAPTWRRDLELSADATITDAEAAFKRLASTAHPDRGGNHDAMARLIVARDQARKELSA